jgi:hypothetical protein
MKRHLVLVFLITILGVSCASNEHKSRLSQEEARIEKLEYSKHEGNTGRDVSRH